MLKYIIFFSRKENLNMDKKDLKKIFLLIFLSIITYWTINNLSILGNCINKISEIIFPFILGGALAFIINIPMSFFERKLVEIKFKKKILIKNKKTLRTISLILAIIVIIGIFFIIINLIVPELINVIEILINNIPYYAEEISKFLENNTDHIEEINSLLSNTNFDANSIKNELMGIISNLLSSSISIVVGVVGVVIDLIISIVFTIYILTSKEKLQLQFTKILKAYFKESIANKIIEVGKTSNKIFRNFFTVQCLEATILGSLCIIGMLILKIPYAVPVGILVGVTALIPVVGAFIGIIVGAILIVSVNPIKVVTFVIFVLVLQQIEGNIIYPKVVGGSVGLPGMWVLVAVTVGGSLFGIIGMLLGVPTISVIYTVLKSDVEKRLNQKI